MTTARLELNNDMSEVYAEFDTEATEKLARTLGRPIDYVDAEGYENSIYAAAIHPEKGWLAWVEARHKTANNWIYAENILREKLGESTTVDWNIKTYNPAFGCYVHYLSQ